MSDTFWWNDLELAYEDGEYNAARTNERAVEVPIARYWVEQRVLHASFAGFEVGNVLSHYGAACWPIVDRYEGPITVDVLDIHVTAPLPVPAPAVDWIVAVSTLEHVRWDEEPRDPEGTTRALAHLRSLLAPRGRLLVTIPFGIRGELDAAILGHTWLPAREWVMVRHADDPRRWSEQPVIVHSWRPYGNRAGATGANAVWIAEFTQ